MMCHGNNRGRWEGCQCLTCVYNCDGEHWHPGAHWNLDGDIDPDDFCYFCEEYCYVYDGDLGKHAGVQFECKKYRKSVYYVWQEERIKAKKEEEAAEKARSKIHILRSGSKENEY